MAEAVSVGTVCWQGNTCLKNPTVALEKKMIYVPTTHLPSLIYSMENMRTGGPTNLYILVILFHLLYGEIMEADGPISNLRGGRYYFSPPQCEVINKAYLLYAIRHFLQLLHVYGWILDKCGRGRFGIRLMNDV